MTKKEAVNPLKDLTIAQLKEFFKTITELDDDVMEIFNKLSLSWEGFLSEQGLGLLRAAWVAMSAVYKKYGIPLENTEIPTACNLCKEDFRFLMEHDDDEIDPGEQLWDNELGKVLMENSKLNGIGDFISFEGFDYLPISDVLMDIYGTSYRRLFDEVDEDDEEEQEEGDELIYDIVEENVKLFPPEVTRHLFALEEDCESGYIGEIIDTALFRSEKIGKVNALIVGLETKNTILECYKIALPYLYQKNRWYMSDWVDSIYHENVWYGITITAGDNESGFGITPLQRMLCIRGLAYFVQEIADRILDGRINVNTLVATA